MLRKFLLTSIAGCVLAMGAEVVVKVGPPAAIVETRPYRLGRAMFGREAIIAGMETGTSGLPVNGDKLRTSMPTGWTIAGNIAKTIMFLSKATGSSSNFARRSR
jgi:hypothetical protein